MTERLVSVMHVLRDPFADGFAASGLSADTFYGGRGEDGWYASCQTSGCTRYLFGPFATEPEADAFAADWLTKDAHGPQGERA